jgi:GntR family transcriptional regulator, transcriptional repressor for pyruvate dehydrogenase complex
MFKPVEKKSLADAVFEQLREQIVSGRMEPGDALPAERALSDMLGVNRGAVREALKRLEQARLITIQQGGSTRVLDFRETAGTDLLSALLVRPDGTVDTRVARSVLEMRSALAADAARHAARRATSEQRARLDAICKTMHEQRDDILALQELSMAFWKTLVEASDNVAYQLSLNSLDESYSKFKHVMLHVMAEELSNREGYLAILRAVAERDEEEAAHAALLVVGTGQRRLEGLLARLDQQLPEDAATP